VITGNPGFEEMPGAGGRRAAGHAGSVTRQRRRSGAAREGVRPEMLY